MLVFIIETIQFVLYVFSGERVNALVHWNKVEECV